jgi:anaerobic magnesium-protoporphyrin IX monomethyl ester cyclase
MYMTPGRGRRTVLLAHSYFMRHDPKQLERMKPYPPLATLITAGVIRERGFDVALFDAMIANGVDDFAAMLTRCGPPWSAS